MTENAGYVREPLVAAKEAFGGELSVYLETVPEEMVEVLKGYTKRPHVILACCDLFRYPNATANLAALMEQKNDCLPNQWNNEPTKQRLLLGTMFELELGWLRALSRQPQSNEQLEENRKREGALLRFGQLLDEQQIPGGETLK